ncbi:hypothetical protein J6590_064442 [Homalodisca vitripennis]|nr:hypothetical protein J6590_064442 [Homalodisca vitripennis]
MTSPFCDPKGLTKIIQTLSFLHFPRFRALSCAYDEIMRTPLHLFVGVSDDVKVLKLRFELLRRRLSLGSLRQRQIPHTAIKDCELQLNSTFKHHKCFERAGNGRV